MLVALARFQNKVVTLRQHGCLTNTKPSCLLNEMAANFEASVKGVKSNIFLKFSNSLVSAFESFCADMSSIKRKQKHSIDTPDDFESLAELSEGQDKFLQDIITLKAKVQLNEAPMNNICVGLTTLNHFKSIEVQSQLHDTS